MNFITFNFQVSCNHHCMLTECVLDHFGDDSSFANVFNMSGTSRSNNSAMDLNPSCILLKNVLYLNPCRVWILKT